MVRMKRFAAVAAFTFLFLQVTDSSHASVTVELSAAVTIEELAQNPWKDSWLRAAEMDLPALMAFVDSKSGIRAADLQAVSILATRIFQARKPKGARAAGKEIAKEKYGWGSYQFGCLNTLWTKESHWNFRAQSPYRSLRNPTSATSGKDADQGRRLADQSIDPDCVGTSLHRRPL